MVILKDSVRYVLWERIREINDFEPMVKYHIKDIFGKGCEYFPKRKLKTLANNRSIPDGFVVDFEKKKWYIVELKLLCDDAIRRIRDQLGDYKSAIENLENRRKIYKSIKSIRDVEFLDDLINEKDPIIVVVINSLDGDQGIQFKEKVYKPYGIAKIIEFKTFFREGADPKKVHIHLFEPLYKPTIKDYEIPPTFPGERIPVKKSFSPVRKAKKVTFQELINEGLIKDGQTLYFYHTQLFQNEQAVIKAPEFLRYKGDGKTYSCSKLAKALLIKHGFKHDDHGVAGPKYWKTEDGKLLDELNEQIRIKRVDRK